MKTKRLEKLMAKFYARNPLVAGEVRYVSVMHDDWCRFLKGKGDCNCNPEFSFAPRSPQPGDINMVSIVPAPPASHN